LGEMFHMSIYNADPGCGQDNRSLLLECNTVLTM
jgi:hypothetical protein